MGGASFDVRKVQSSSFPHGLNDELFKDREFVVVKHPRVDSNDLHDADVLSELATELQILRHPPLRQHANIIDFLGVMYHDAGDAFTPNVLPALVLEYAELGSVKDYQWNGYGSSYADKLDILIDTAKGLEALHSCGIIHGDIKTSNLLVCKHSERKFIVKLIDFGFSLSENDERFVGFTKKLEAPEASTVIDRRYLCQLDIYSYGLLLHTVFKDGVSFFESIPEEDREENVNKLKNSSILAATTQLNLLRYLQDEKCAAFLLCKILAYSLQKYPSHRFKDMSRILTLLEFAKPFELSVPTDRGEHRPLTIDEHRKLKELQLEILRNLIESYCASFSDEKMPLMPILRSEYEQRAQREAELFYKSHGDWDSMQSFLAVTIGLTRDTLGLVPEVNTLADSESILALEQRTFNIYVYMSVANLRSVKLPSVYGVVRKSPTGVQQRIASDLQSISSSNTDISRKSAAMLNLAWAYVDEVGVGYDIQKAGELVRQSAILGNARAQELLLDVFYTPQQTSVDPSIWQGWLVNIAEQGIARPLCAVKSASRENESNTQQIRRRKETFADFTSSLTYDQNTVDGEASDGCYSKNWRKLFLRFAIINDQLELVQMLLDHEPSIIDQIVCDQETSLLLSCRHGNARVTKCLLEKGAMTDCGVPNGVQPLHWLVTFTEEEQRDVARMLKIRGANIDAWANVIKDKRDIPSAFSDLPVGGTALHWSIIAKDISALHTLMDLGADPLYRFGEGKSAFEFACSLRNSAAVEFFLQYERVKLAVPVFRPLGEGVPVLVQPLFFVVGNESRWTRLVRHGLQFEEEQRKVIDLLVTHGAPTDSVLEVQDQKMTATFAVAWHDCNADVLRSGLRYGFQDHLENKWGSASSGGTPLFLAITHRNREMFLLLLEHGANVEALDMYGLDPVLRACKETDDLFYIQKLVEVGARLKKTGRSNWSAFYIAVHNGNLKTAQYLYDQGFDKDEMLTESESELKDPNDRLYRSILGTLLFSHTRNAERRIQFLLTLPDRDGDGFIVFRHGEDKFSALHVAVPMIGEDPEEAETTRLIVFTLLQKYKEKHHINSTDGPHHSTVLGMATEIGNYKVVKALLEAGADPNIPDEYGRLPLDLLYWRYCYPDTTEALKSVNIEDKPLVKRTLGFVNRNTSEILSLLTSYDAKPSVFRFPTWFEDDSGYRSFEWVMERLQENRSKPQTGPSTEPVWGSLPITIPERPMQFKRTQ
ncbi:ankyrin [Cenococcum geophilum 1.58]|uniref:ankyrin n=1 Tax=Cenococcum geophilum 1.58 TaxID=794803 RepID=UPI0035901F42|nr:ankyrin [Cenococcum geophilum 1.58]